LYHARHAKPACREAYARKGDGQASGSQGLRCGFRAGSPGPLGPLEAVGYLSSSRTFLAHSALLCGFWPVTSVPATQTLEFQSSPFS